MYFDIVMSPYIAYKIFKIWHYSTIKVTYNYAVSTSEVNVSFLLQYQHDHQRILLYRE
jgi:hypothetical protein